MNGKKSTAGNSVLSVFTGNTGIIGVLVILCVVVALATDKFLTPSNIISVLRQISINTYIALGMTLIIILGHIDLAVGAIVAMSGTLTVGFVVNQGLPIGVAIAAGIIIGVVAGCIEIPCSGIYHYDGNDECLQRYRVCIFGRTVHPYYG